MNSKGKWQSANNQVNMKRIIQLILYPLIWLKVWLVRLLVRWRSKLQFGTLRQAIHDADDNKEATGRKNMVVFNSTSGQFEPVQKRMLKNATRAGKNKSNKAMTDGRKRMLAQNKGKKGRVISIDRVKHIEKKSLYVTK
jgi:hypothetical protein